MPYCINLLLEHRHSNYQFKRETKKGKDNEFETSRLWKAAYTVRDRGLPGTKRLVRIIELSDKRRSASVADNNGVMASSRADDMVLRVMGVMALVSSGSPLSAFDDAFMQGYLYALNPQHKPAYRLERIRIIEVLMDLMVQQFVNIIEDRRELLGDSFVSGQTDMWTDPHRREQFGGLVFNVVAKSYQMTNGRRFFMSDETAAVLKTAKMLKLVRYIVVCCLRFVCHYHYRIISNLICCVII